MGNWKQDSLDGICNIVKGEQLNKLDLERSGEYPCINGGIEPSGYTNKWNRLENTITISEGGNSCGFINYLKVKFWSGGHCYTLQDIKDGFDTDYLYYALKGKEYKIMGLRVGSGLPNIQQKAIKSFEIQYPEDKPEQTRIAEILSTADEAIAHTEALIAKYQRIKTGLMQDLLTKGIDENGNIRSKETHKFVVKNGIEVPEEWEVIKLIDCVDKSTIITYGIVQTGLHVLDGVRVLRTVDLQKDKIESSNLLRTTEEISNSYKRTILKKFDLVCNVRASVGDFNIIDDDDLVGCNTTRGVARISPKKEINPYYLLWFLRSERNTKQMELLIKGTTFIDINIADLREIWIPIPNNISEQDKIAEKLIQITDTLQDYNRQLLKLQSLKTGLMQDLLSGKVRVNMDNKN